MPPTEEPAPIAGEGYELVFEDDFLGTSLNTDIWVPPPHHGTSFPGGGVVSVANSILTLNVPFDLTPRNYVEAWSLGPQSPVENGYPRYPDALAWQEGYFECRTRVTNDPWTKHTMWMFSLEQENAFQLTRNCSMLNAEWDIFENGNRAGFAGPTAYADVNHVHVRHRNTTGPTVCGVPDSSDHQNVNGTGFTDWHVWGGKWTGTKIQSYLDGVLMTTSVPYDSFAQPMALILTSAPLNYSQAQIDQWSIPAPPAAIVTDFDWVRVWQRPQGRARRSTLISPGTSGAYASTPDHASLRVTGDIDIRFEFSAQDMTPAAVQAIVNRASTSNWSYQVALRTNGVIRLAWSADGSATLAADSSVLPEVGGQRIIMRVTMDVDNGSSQRVIRFERGATRTGPWTLINQVTTAGVTSIFAGTRALELGARNSGTQEQLNGSVYWAEIRDGIDGLVVARADFTDKTPGTTPFTSEDGKIWTVFGGAKIMPGNPNPDLYQAVSPQRLA